MSKKDFELRVYTYALLLLTISQNAPSYTFDWVLNMFSGEFCEISKNSFFTEHLSTTASKNKSYPRKS